MKYETQQTRKKMNHIKYTIYMTHGKKETKNNILEVNKVKENPTQETNFKDEIQKVEDEGEERNELLF